MPCRWPQQGPHGATVPQPQQSRPPRAASRGTLNCRAAKERSVINPSYPAQRSHGRGGHQPQLSLPGDAAGSVQSLLLGSQHSARGGCHLGWVPCTGWGYLPGISPTLQVFNPQVIGSYNVLYKLLSTCSCPVCWRVCHSPVTPRCCHGTATPLPPQTPRTAGAVSVPGPTRLTPLSVRPSTGDWLPPAQPSSYFSAVGLRGGRRRQGEVSPPFNLATTLPWGCEEGVHTPYLPPQWGAGPAAPGFCPFSWLGLSSRDRARRGRR